MRELSGIGVGQGIASGPVLRMPDPLPEPSAEPREGSAESELADVRQALDAVAAELASRGEQAGGSAKEVLDAQAMMAQDPSLVDDITSRVESGSTGERAVFEAFASFQEVLTGMGGYMAERAADLADVAQRVIAALRGVPAPGVPDVDYEFVLVAHDLAPADTAVLNLDRVRALVTRDGGPTSHTAILARAKSLPAVVGVAGAEELADGDRVVVDAAAGTIILDPTDEILDTVTVRTEQLAQIATAPITDGALADGTPVPLLANLGSPDEAEHAVALGAEGVGLFRTEFLFLDRDTAPSIEEQRSHYEAVLSAFSGKKVVVRCLDAGADKPLAFLSGDAEENPALGLRGLRALRANEQVLTDQLAALAAAQDSTDAELWVMAPMVADAEEAEYFTRTAREAGVTIAGVMAEVPSIALVADQVAGVTDFVSIGTNDLTQYTMAADRLLGSVAHYQDPWHPAVLRLVELIGTAGRDAAKPVGVCGEAAADPLLAVVLVGLGVSTLSMTPNALAEVRAELLKHTMSDAQRIAKAALAASTAATAREAAREAAHG